MPRPRRFLLSNRSRAFVPTDIPYLALWLDAADSSSVTLDGSNNVSQWNDKSGNARHVTQGTTTTRPSYRTADLNGLNVLRFDGTDDRMTASFTTIPQPTTTFLVFRVSKVTGFQGFYDSLATNPHDFYLSATTPILESGSALSIYGGTATVNVAALMSGQHNGTSSVLRFNRSQVAAGNAGTSGLTSGISIGANRLSNSFVQGDIAEFLFYARVLTAGEITQIENYLSAKWGTP